MCNRILLLFGKMPQWNLCVNCHVNGTAFQSGSRFQTSFSSLRVSCTRALKGDISGITEKDDIHPRKCYFCWNTILIDILDWHSRKSSNDSLYFYEDLYRRFYILLSSEKKTGNLIYRIEIWLLQFTWLEIFYNEEFSVLCTIQPSGLVN